MKTKTIFLALGLLAAGSLVSCSSNNNEDEITRQSISDCFSYFTNQSSGESAVGTTLGYTIELNYTKQTCDFTITGLTMPDGKAYPVVLLPSVPFKIQDDSWIVISAMDIQSQIKGFANAPVFRDFKCSLLHRAVSETYYPGYNVTFNVDGYQVSSSLREQYFFGTTTSTGPNGQSFSTTDTDYSVTLSNDLKTATVLMAGAQFINGMPTMNICLNNVPVRFTNGNILLASAAITPTIGGTPYENYPITDFKALINMAKGATIEFICNPSTPKGSMGEFKVKADLTLTGVQESKN